MWSIVAFIIALLFWTAPSHADAEKWKIVTTIHTKDGEDVHLTYGKSTSGPIYFDSEASCKAALGGADPVFAISKERVDAVVKERGDTAEPFMCVLELQKPKDEI